jgi:hypothetical protein
MQAHEAIREIADGDPDALGLLRAMIICHPSESLDLLLTLEDMNIRGPRVGCAYAEFAHRRSEAFVAAIRERNPEMVATVNRLMPSQTNPATVRGASPPPARVLA